MAIYSEFSHKKWWFSIVMLVYQRVKLNYFDHHQPTRLSQPLICFMASSAPRPPSFRLYPPPVVPSHLGTADRTWSDGDAPMKMGPGIIGSVQRENCSTGSPVICHRDLLGKRLNDHFFQPEALCYFSGKLGKLPWKLRLRCSLKYPVIGESPEKCGPFADSCPLLIMIPGHYNLLRIIEYE